MQITFGTNGWRELVDEDNELGLPGRIHFRMRSVDGHERITELYLDGEGRPIQAGAIRDFPITRLERWAAESRAQFDGGWAADDWPGADLHGEMSKHVLKKPPASEKPEMPNLTAPVDGLTDAFLLDVAKAYSAAIAMGLSPGVTVKNMCGVSLKTANSWFYKARKRGLMPPAARTGRIV